MILASTEEVKSGLHRLHSKSKACPTQTLSQFTNTHFQNTYLPTASKELHIS